MKKTFIIICIILSSCITGKNVSKTGIEEIRFGYGGGFTGKSTTYLLSASGHLSTQGNVKEVLKKIDSKTTLSIFTKAQEIESVSLNEPDNVYSFVQIKTKNSTNRIIWAFGSTKVPKEIILLYDQLISLTK